MKFYTYTLLVTLIILLASLIRSRGETVAKGPRSVRASWYGDECKGRLMANGKKFDPHALTCASWDYPLGTKLRVTHGWRGVTVTVTDRGPAKRLLGSRQLDLSRYAFSALADPKAGVITVTIEPK